MTMSYATIMHFIRAAERELLKRASTCPDRYKPMVRDDLDMLDSYVAELALASLAINADEIISSHRKRMERVAFILSYSDDEK